MTSHVRDQLKLHVRRRSCLYHLVTPYCRLALITVLVNCKTLLHLCNASKSSVYKILVAVFCCCTYNMMQLELSLFQCLFFNNLLHLRHHHQTYPFHHLNPSPLPPPPFPLRQLLQWHQEQLLLHHLLLHHRLQNLVPSKTCLLRQPLKRQMRKEQPRKVKEYFLMHPRQQLTPRYFFKYDSKVGCLGSFL